MKVTPSLSSVYNELDQTFPASFTFDFREYLVAVLAWLDVQVISLTGWTLVRVF